MTRRDPLVRIAARKIGRRWLAWRFRNFDPDKEPEREASVNGLKLQVLPDVFNPAHHFTSAFFAKWVRSSGVVRSGAKVLDIGTGSGILAISAALAGADSVAAIDLNPAAVESARLNVSRHNVGNIVTVYEGDMFEPVAGHRFDVVLCNPPYLRGEPRSMASRAYWGGEGLEWLHRFGKELHGYLIEGGECIVSIGDAADVEGIVLILQECGWRVEEAARRDILFEIIYLLRLRE